MLVLKSCVVPLRSVTRSAISLNLRRTLQTGTAAGETEQCFIENLSGDDKGISILCIDRPRAKNALSRKLIESFRKAVGILKHDNETRVVLLKSMVQGSFCAGADLKERATMSVDEVKQFLHTVRVSFHELEALPIPTIALIDGVALGGGLELALCCDMRVAGEHAKVGLPETKLAIIPGAGGTQRLSRLIGLARAKELIYTGRILDAQQALKEGIVNYAAKEGSGYQIALNLAREILPGGPIALRMAKVAIDHGSQLDLDAGLKVEQSCYDQVLPTEDRIEALKAFAEKRRPVFKGR
ncbi:1064_t:CDS:10 [Paraglomus brasilianum]|uniref:1064_t:CDS:1 n=1 Tax=Paraglomus brasilianum TaxID=144538 RepID=A0A9N9BXG3_9GLOM|nr:1064_t:CDS:10 [Paraglomus brasilianum]